MPSNKRNRRRLSAVTDGGDSGGDTSVQPHGSSKRPPTKRLRTSGTAREDTAAVDEDAFSVDASGIEDDEDDGGSSDSGSGLRGLEKHAANARGEPVMSKDKQRYLARYGDQPPQKVLGKFRKSFEMHFETFLTHRLHRIYVVKMALPCLQALRAASNRC